MDEQNSVDKFLTNVNNLMSGIRSKNISPGAEPSKSTAMQASFTTPNDYGDDWRVRVSIPQVGTFSTSPMFDPLRETNNSLVWPTVPTVLLSNTAQYNEITNVHSNYPFPQYQSSRPEEIQISGQFPVQNDQDGKYWIAAVHFCRSVTKMFYGETSNKGSPPPLLKLNGYGDYVLKNLPVVMTSFTVDLPADVDYIKASYNTSDDLYNNYTGQAGYVPSLSTITCTFKVTYSRNKVANFNLDDFVNGRLINQGYI